MAIATAPPTRCSHIIARDRDWEEGKARDQLLQLFEVVGLEDPWVARAAPPPLGHPVRLKRRRPRP